MKNIFLILSIIVVFSSCKTINISNENVRKINSKKLEKIINKNDFEFDYFSCKARIIYNKQNFTANIRIKQDSIIWISLTGLFNIEGARIIILKDHYEMINKLNGLYENKSFSSLENVLPLMVDYNILENLLIGNFIEKKLKKQNVETKDNKYVVKGNIDNYNVLYSILPFGKINSIDIKSLKNDNRIQAEYNKYEKVNNQDFSIRRKFEIETIEEKNTLDLKFYKFKFEKVNFPFKRP